MVKNADVSAVRPGAPAHPVQPDEEAVPDAAGGVQAAGLGARARRLQQDPAQH